jgi:6-phosphogluconate dehydrogenase
MTAEDMHDNLRRWNEGRSIPISSRSPPTSSPCGTRTVRPLDKILDTAGQKGTGKWTGINALELGMPLTLIGEAVFARCLSALKDESVAAAGVLGTAPGRIRPVIARPSEISTRRCTPRRSFPTPRASSSCRGRRENGWSLNFGAIALMWRGGCIIRSSASSARSVTRTRVIPQLPNLLLDEFFSEIVVAQAGWRRCVATATAGIPVPRLSTALAYYDGYRSERLPANLLQAQRDYFGAHTYERLDKPRGEFFHTNWTGTGGDVASSTYQV